MDWRLAVCTEAVKRDAIGFDAITVEGVVVVDVVGRAVMVCV
jgi:hypothetical protein